MAGIIGNSFLIAVIWGGLVTVLFLIFADIPLKYFYPDADNTLVKMTALCLPALILFEYSINIVRGQNRIKLYSFILVLKEVILLGSLILLLVLGIIDVTRSVYCWILAAVVVSIFAAFSALSGNKFRIGLNFQVWRPMAKFGLQAHTANLSSFLKTRIDWLLIPYFLDSASLGYYSNACAIILVLWFMPTAVAKVLGPHISWRENSSGDQLTPVLCRITLFITVLAGILLILLGKLGIRIAFGSDFLPSYLPLVIMIPGAILYSISKLLAGDLSGRGLPHYAMKISIAILFINVTMNLLLIPVFGIAGAAMAASTTYAGNGILFLLAFKKESHTRLVDTLIIKKSDFVMMLSLLKSWSEKRSNNF